MDAGFSRETRNLDGLSLSAICDPEKKEYRVGHPKTGSRYCRWRHRGATLANARGIVFQRRQPEEGCLIRGVGGWGLGGEDVKRYVERGVLVP